MELLSVAAIIISIIAISRTSDISLKIKDIEMKLNGGNNKSKSPTSSLNQSAISKEIIETEFEEEVPAIVQSASVEVPVERYEESAFVKWMKEDWLLKLGGVLIIMGVLFFLSVAFKAVGPQGKVVIGYIFGLSLMLSGFFYAKKQIIGGGAIHLIGAIVIIITTYLARQPSYNLFDPYLATLLMFLTTVCVAITAFAYQRSQLAHAALVIAAAVPMLTNTDGGSFFGLLIYLGVVTLGVLWLALVTKWRTLVLWSLVIVCMYSSIKITGGFGYTDVSIEEKFLLLGFGVMFYITSLFSILRSNGETGKVDGIIALLNAGFSLMWITALASPEVSPIIIAVVGLVYATGFFFVYKTTDMYISFIVYGGVALGLLTTSVMLELSGRAETVALLLIGAGATWFTHYLSNDEKITKIVSIFNILPLLGIFISIFKISDVIYMNQGFSVAVNDLMIVVLAMVIYFALYGYFVSRLKDLSQVSLLAGICLSVIFTWQVAHLLFTVGFATFISILLYTIVGLFVLFNGTEEKNDTKVKLAKFWLGLVAARVIFWDAWQVGSTTLGVAICVVIGILLLSSTFIIKKVATE